MEYTSQQLEINITHWMKLVIINIWNIHHCICRWVFRLEYTSLKLILYAIYVISVQDECYALSEYYQFHVMWNVGHNISRWIILWRNLFINVNQLDALNFYNQFISSLYVFRAHALIVRRIELYYTVSGIITPIGGRPVHGTATYRCDDTRDCIIQFCPPDDEHMCPKHVEVWNKFIIKNLVHKVGWY